MRSAVRLLCIPYAGASAVVFRPWSRRLPGWMQLQPVELPGRGARMDEPLATDPHILASDLAKALRGDVEGPYALLGHSLGALLAYELAHALIERGARPPVLLVVSGTEAPSVRDDRDYRRLRTDAELISDLHHMKGTPEEVLASPELMAEVLPVLRADFLMCGAFVYRSRPPLPCPIRALGGSDGTPLDALRAWADETSADFGLDVFPGSHFFIHERQAEVLGVIARDLEARTLGDMRACA